MLLSSIARQVSPRGALLADCARGAASALLARSGFHCRGVTCANDRVTTSSDTTHDDATTGSRTRSVHQESVVQEPPEGGTAMRRSPDAPSDPSLLIHHLGSDPEEVKRRSAWKASEVFTGGPDNMRKPDDDRSGGNQDSPHLGVAHALGRMAAGVGDKVKDIAQSASDTVTGAERDPYEEAAKKLDKQEGINRGH